MASGSITISGTISGEPTGLKQISETIQLPSAVGQITDVVLASGDNTIAVPAGSTLAIIQPPSGNTQALKLKGIAGDTGVSIHKTSPTVLALDPSQANFILNAAALTTGSTEINFL